MLLGISQSTVYFLNVINKCLLFPSVEKRDMAGLWFLPATTMFKNTVGLSWVILGSLGGPLGV
jgi:hypothetical protein